MSILFVCNFVLIHYENTSPLLAHCDIYKRDDTRSVLRTYVNIANIQTYCHCTANVQLNYVRVHLYPNRPHKHQLHVPLVRPNIMALLVMT